MVQSSDGWDPDRMDSVREMPEASDRGADTGDGHTELSSRASRAGSQNDSRATSSWQDIKSRFVDDPAGAIAAAEDLLRQAVEDKIRAIRDEAAAICSPEGDDRDDGASATENRRMRLLQYQTYCERLARSAGY
jgi:hypothetical protein